tara:strand:- start:1627 stop:2025 length:399 start_codon:yes stop_codon:yes gene_type:complete
MDSNPLIPVGAKIKVDKSKIENLLSEKSLNDLPKVIIGKVVDYKMTDGMGIGYVLTTENNITFWIFNNELNEQTNNEYKLKDQKISRSQEKNDSILRNFNVIYDINGTKTIKTVANPINLISWLIFTLKDVF